MILPRRFAPPLLSLLFLLVLATSCAAESGGAGATNLSGPLTRPERHVWSVPVTRVGTVFSDGLETIRNDGNRPVVIDSVESVGGDQAFEFLGARIGTPGRPDDFNQKMTGYPPRELPNQFQEPAVGSTLEPGSVYMLILGYGITANIWDVRTSIIVNYHDASQSYRLLIPAFLVACPDYRLEDECLQSVTRKW